MIPERFHDFLLASAAMAAALIGLLLVSRSPGRGNRLDLIASFLDPPDEEGARGWTVARGSLMTGQQGVAVARWRD